MKIKIKTKGPQALYTILWNDWKKLLCYRFCSTHWKCVAYYIDLSFWCLWPWQFCLWGDISLNTPTHQSNTVPELQFNSRCKKKKFRWIDKLAKQSSLATHDSVAISSGVNSEINEVLFLIDSEYKWITTLIRTGDKSSDSTTEFRSLISFLLMCFLIDFFIYTVVCKLNINIYLK